MPRFIFTMNVGNDGSAASAACRHLRTAYPDAGVVIIAAKTHAHTATALANEARTGALVTDTDLYAVRHRGSVVAVHLRAFLESDADVWFKIDPDTLIRRPLTWTPAEPCFFGTVQTSPGRIDRSLQGGCIGGIRPAAERVLDSGLLESPELDVPEATWADTALLRARAANRRLVSFDFVLAWACRALDIPLVDHPEIRSGWLAPPPDAAQAAISHPHKTLASGGDPDWQPTVPQQCRALLDALVADGTRVAVVADKPAASFEGPRWSVVEFRCAAFANADGQPEAMDEALAKIEQLEATGVRYLLVAAPLARVLRGEAALGTELAARYVLLANQTCALLYDLERSTSLTPDS